jgi:hypothetical protein
MQWWEHQVIPYVGKGENSSLALNYDWRTTSLVMYPPVFDNRAAVTTENFTALGWGSDHSFIENFSLLNMVIELGATSVLQWMQDVEILKDIELGSQRNWWFYNACYESLKKNHVDTAEWIYKYRSIKAEKFELLVRSYMAAFYGRLDVLEYLCDLSHDASAELDVFDELHGCTKEHWNAVGGFVFDTITLRHAEMAEHHDIVQWPSTARM